VRHGIHGHSAEAKLIVAVRTLDVIVKGFDKAGRVTRAKAVASVQLADIVDKVLRHKEWLRFRKMLFREPDFFRNQGFGVFVVNKGVISHRLFLHLMNFGVNTPFELWFLRS
jgi:hypothetical protein